MSAPSWKLLTPAQRRLLIGLAVAFTFLLANSIYLFGIGQVPEDGATPLPAMHQSMLLLHLGLGVLLLPLTIGFAVWHLGRALLRRTKGAITSGLSVVVTLLVLLVTGLLIVSEANSEANAWAVVAHQIAAVLAPVAYLVHRLRSKSAPDGRRIGRALIQVAGIAIALFAVHLVEVSLRPDPPAPAERITATLDPEIARHLPVSDPFLPFVGAADPDPDSPFFPALTTTHSGGHAPADIIHGGEVPTDAARKAEIAARGFVADHAIGADSCRECHPDVVAQWEASAHRFASFNNPFYTSAVVLTRETHGRQRTQWCAGCHDPALLFPGTLMEAFDETGNEAQTGISCTTCHLIDKLHGTAGNGGYRLDDVSEQPYLFAEADGVLGMLNAYLLKARPDAHRARMKKPFFETSEYCASCHKVSFESYLNDYKWLRGQNQYDGWHDTGVAHNNPMTWYEPPTTRTCQDCHMPPEDALLGDVSAVNGKVKSHRFLAANTALPALRGDREMLALTETYLQDDRVKVTVFALRHEDGAIATAIGDRPATVRPGETVQIDVVVRNKDVGHTFPAGTNDSNQGWIEFEVIGPDGQHVWHHGKLDAERFLDPSAHVYQAVLIDRDGNKIDRRNALDIHTPIYANVIPPSTSDVVRYRFKLPENLPEGAVTVRAKLNWRKFNEAYKRFSLPDNQDFELPVTVMDEHEVQVTVSRDATPTATDDPPKSSWMSLNDWGIGSLLDGDGKTAQEAFEGVIRLHPDKVDGWRNLARVFLREGDLTRAETNLRKATDLAPSEARTAFFWGVLLEEKGGADLERAAEAYEGTLTRYPRSRQTLDRLANVQWLLGRDEEALKTALKVLEIDPEHLRAHYQRLRVYRRLLNRAENEEVRRALRFAVAQAEKAWEKYKEDEDAAAKSLEYRKRNPHDQRMSLSRTVHEQPGL